jgi:hypothetical protein
MSEVCLVVREAERDWSGTIHGSCADRAVAALSADPVTIDELALAMARFAKPAPERRFFASFSRGLRAEPYDAGLVVIDLLARLVVVDSTYSAPGPEGFVRYHNGRSCTTKDLRYHLADDWLFVRDGDNWEHVAEKRRRDRATNPDRDTREVFYGRPLLEFVGRECFAAFVRRDEIAAGVRAQTAARARIRRAKEFNVAPDSCNESEQNDEESTPTTWPGHERDASAFRDALKDIHAAWLLTPRDDLGGESPREVALRRHKHINWDLEDRCRQWSSLGECPPGLAKSSHAFLHGGFGTHELVEYYGLVRELLWSCWEQLTEPAQSPKSGRLPEFFSVGDFLTTEVSRLGGIREAWLDAPDPEFHGRTPRSIIASERARLPEAVSGHDAIVDPDCPCCQMMGELSGPMFWHLDGSEMDDEFAFDMQHRTLEEWAAERKEWEEQSKRYHDCDRRELPWEEPTGDFDEPSELPF